MQREPKRRTAGEVEHRDELAEQRRKRSPRIPGLPRDRAAAPSDDERYRLPAAAAVSESHAHFLAFLDANPRAMECMLTAAWDAACAAAPHDDPWARAASALADCRAQLEHSADAEDLRLFDEWRSQYAWPAPDPYQEHEFSVARLPHAQGFVWRASSFAGNATIAAYMKTSEEAVRQHQLRLRRLGLHDDDAAAEIPDLVEIAVRRLGCDTEPLREGFDRVDLSDVEALRAVRENYERCLFATMRSLLSDA